MALLESPHPSPLFRTSLAIVEPFSPSPNPLSHHREPPEPLSILFRHLGSHLAVVDPHRAPLTVAEPLSSVIKPLWPL